MKRNITGILNDLCTDIFDGFGEELYGNIQDRIRLTQYRQLYDSTEVITNVR